MLQSSCIEDHMKTIGIERSSFSMYTFEHRCTNNIKNIYQHAGNCDDQKNPRISLRFSWSLHLPTCWYIFFMLFIHLCLKEDLKDIIDAAILSTPEVFTDNIPNVHMPSTPVKKPSTRKSLCLFTNILDVQPKTAKRHFVAAKYRRKDMKVCNILWTKKIKTKRAFKNQWADKT